MQAFHQRAVEQLGHDLARCHKPSDQGQVQADRLQVAQRQVAVAFMPGLVALEGLAEQLAGSDGQHQGACTRNEERGNTECIQAKAFPFLQAPGSRVGIGHGCRNRQQAGFVLEAGQVQVLVVAERLGCDGHACGAQVRLPSALPRAVKGRVARGVEVLLQQVEKVRALVLPDVGRESLAGIGLQQQGRQRVVYRVQVAALTQGRVMAGQVKRQPRAAGIDQHDLVQRRAEQRQLPAPDGATLQQLFDLIARAAVEQVAQIGKVGCQAQAAFLYPDGQGSSGGLGKVVFQVCLVSLTQVQVTAQYGESGRLEWQPLYLVVFRLQWKVRQGGLHAQGSGALYQDRCHLNVFVQGNGAFSSEHLVAGEVLQGGL